ncbi:MobF family relaxase [Arthrobacter sp. 31Y]|uniref:MobF family relaxase n=1 Tax=Arthrobacter sp. 31Y TaxID=1115632 RepID=UPI000467D8A0|nr:MobF family relaxase [Arthrobacter sp. 31Y]
MTVSIGRINIDYYLESAAAGDGAQIGTRDLTAYYTETQAPPGRWHGRGLDGVGLGEGQQVTKWEAKSIYEEFKHPETGQELGARPIKSTNAPEGAKTPMGAEAKTGREAVAGFDLTFSPPKSVSILWALADPKVQADLYEAHQQAVAECLDWLERNAIQARAGHAGVAWVPVKGAIASLFDHWDSRAGDPQLHTHAVIANRVQRTSDGKWVTLDSYTLHRHIVAVSEKYNSILFDRIHERTGAVAELRDGIAGMTGASLEDLEEPGTDPHNARAELAGIPDGLITEFSTRSLDIEARTDELITAWEEQYGRRPSPAMILRLRGEATLATRKAKKPATESLPEKMIGWRERALATGYAPATVIRDAIGHDTAVVSNGDIAADVVDLLGSFALHDAGTRRTTFTRANLIAATERLLRGIRMGTASDREQLVDRIVESAAGQAEALSPERMGTPETENPFLTVRGRSAFEHEETKRYTTTQILDDEAFLINRATTATTTGMEEHSTGVALAAARTREGHTLSPDQVQAAQRVLTSGKAIDAIIGPAGTGKTTTMKAVRDLWEDANGQGSVVGLAPSAVAAAVLGEEIDAATDNVAKWLYESVGDGAARRALTISKLETELANCEGMFRQAPSRSGARARAKTRVNAAAARLAAQYAEQAKYRMRPGQLVILDEASMIGTAAAAELTRQADTAGAKLLFVGDPAQIDAVEAGGFLGWLERNTDAPVLSVIWRFKNEWEGAASLRLRAGDEDVLKVYQQHGRIQDCHEGTAADSAYQAWMADTEEDITASLLIAGDNETVNDLNTRAQLDLAAAGRIDLNTTTQLRYGVAGIGDLVLARKNNRRLRDSDGHFIKNGTRLTITGIDHLGSITAKRADTGATISLDLDYLKANVELGYACTAHRSQGVTVNTAHTVVASGQARELFYVAMTRGKNGNTCYVDVPDNDQDDTPDQWGMVKQIVLESALAVLKGVLANKTHEMTAHEVRDAEHGQANDFARLIFEYDYTAAAEKTLTLLEWLDKNVSAERKQEITTDKLFPALIHAGPPTVMPPNFDLEAATIKDFLKASAKEPTEGALVGDIGTITTSFTTTSAEGQRLKNELETRIRTRLNQLTPPLDGDGAPDWVTQLRAEYPDAPNLPSIVRAVTAWREVSGQQDAQTPWGDPPKTTDKTMTGYYELARKHLPPRQYNTIPGEPVDLWANIDEDLAKIQQLQQELEDFEEEHERFLDSFDEPLPEGWEEILAPPAPAENQHSSPADAGWEL